MVMTDSIEWLLIGLDGSTFKVNVKQGSSVQMEDRFYVGKDFAIVKRNFVSIYRVGLMFSEPPFDKLRKLIEDSELRPYRYIEIL